MTRETVLKARRLVKAGQVHKLPQGGGYAVTSSDGTRDYLVAFDTTGAYLKGAKFTDVASCNCKAGRSEQACSHALAAVLVAVPAMGDYLASGRTR